MHLRTPSARAVRARRHDGRPGRSRTTRGALAVAVALGLVAPLGAAPAAADVAADESSPAAAAWLAGRLAADAAPSGERLTDAILAFAAAQAGAADADAAFDRLSDVADDYLGADLATTAGNAAKVVLAANALGRDPVVDGYDAEAVLRARIEPDGRVRSFGSGGQFFVQSLAVLALTTTDGGVPDEVVDFLAAGACGTDGSYTLTGGCGRGEVDTTAVATQALLAAGRGADAQVAWLRGQQASSGGLPTSDPNANSSALAAQALRAAGNVADADAAAAFVAGLQRGCDASAEERGSIATYPDASADVWLATAQGVFAQAPPMAELDLSTATAGALGLTCTSGAACPTATGVTVVVDFGTLAPNGDVLILCATDLPRGASGLEVLEAAGFALTTEDFEGDLGAALCAIDGQPALPAGECFDPSFDYWSYWSADRGGTWTEYQVGAGSTTPAAGTVEGFRWGAFPADPPRVDPPAFDVAPTAPFDRGIDRACPGSYQDPFRDVAGNVHASAIRCLVAGDITRGSSDPTRYAPRDVVTRGQLASFLARAYETATGTPLPAGPARFDDVRGNTHERNILALAAAGVIEGVGDGRSYAPARTVNRGQMAILLDRFLDLLDDDEVNRSFPPATDVSFFADVRGTFHQPAIDRLAVRGVIQGRSDGTYGSIAGVTRDQMATFIARSLDLAVEVGIGRPVG